MNAVILSAYNGEKYLRQQIDSVLAQTVDDFRLLIRDDGSQDETAAVIRSYCDPRITLLAGENIGITPSFCVLLQEALRLGATRVFFCDQDDIWHPNKLEIMLNAFTEETDIPELVFSDFRMIDSNGDLINSSFMTYAAIRIPEDGDFFPKLLAQPYVFGCACGINRALLEMTAQIPAEAEMYDCWIAMTAALTGKVHYLPQATIDHRFHNSNATGKAGQNSFVSRLRRLTADFAKQRKNTRCRLSQIPLLLQWHEPKIRQDHLDRLTDLENARKQSNITLLRRLKAHGVNRGGRMQNLFFHFTVLMQKRRI